MKNEDDFKAEAAAHRKNEQDSFERSDTDGFLSQWASGINARVADANARIAANGGVARFWSYVATDAETGESLDFRRAHTRYGFKLVVLRGSQEVWIDPNAREATNRRKGVVIGRTEFTAPAHAATWAPPRARGLGGATSVTVRVFPDDREVTWDGVVS